MPHRSDEELEAVADELDLWLDEVDPATLEFEDARDLAAVAQAVDAVTKAEERLLDAVGVARSRGRSWNRIALSLGVSRQAARQRFADKVEA